MSKRNFILLIIVVVIIAVIALLFFSFSKNPTNPSGTGEENFFSKFNPFGKSKDVAPPEEPPADISGTGEEPAVEAPVKLHKVSSMPIAGFRVFTKERYKEIPVVTPPAPTTEQGLPLLKTPPKKPTPPPTEFVSAVRYMDRANGNTYQTFADKINERKFTSTVIPKVYDAYFGAKAESVVMRYLKPDDITIATFAGSLPKEVLGADETGENQIKGSFLPEGIKDISVSPDLLKIFYLFEAGESAVGITSGILGDKKVQVFDSAFTEWLSGWPASSMITLTTKPYFGLPGYMYAIDPAKKDFKKVLSGINGLTTLTSPNGKLVLYGDNNLSLSVYNTSTKNGTAVGVRTMPEKCIWTKASDMIYCAVPKSANFGSFPDSWYKGEVSFSDEIWKIDVASGNTALVVDPITVVGGEDIDGIKLALDKDEKYLFFVNKKDSFLWELDLR